MQLTALSLALTRIGLGGFGVGSALNLDMTSGNRTLDPRITFSRASNAMVTGPDGTLQYAPHNLLTHSEQFDATPWVKTGLTVNANATTAPDGTTTADKIVETAATSQHLTYQAQSVPSGVVATRSIYAKAAEWTSFFLQIGSSGPVGAFNLLTQTATPSVGATAATITPVGDGWFRCSVTGPSNGDAAQYVYRTASTYAGNGTDGLFIWGAQLNIGSLQPYYPTTVMNLLGFTQEFDNAAWTKSNSLIQTNFIRNNTMQGAVVGTPGTLPTNWTAQVNTTTGLTREIVGTGIDSGINYIDVRLSGAASGAGTFDLFFEVASSIASLTGQTWTGSVYWKLQAGSTAGLSAAQFRTYEYTSGIVFVVAQSANLSFPTSAALSTQRVSAALTLSGGATTAFQRPLIAFNIASGAAIDITLRIGLPQLVQGATAGDVVATYGTARAVMYPAPDGSVTADKLVEDTATSFHRVSPTTVAVVAGTTITTSVYARAAERSGLGLFPYSSGAGSRFNLATGTVISQDAGVTASIVSVGNGWYRCAASIVAPASSAAPWILPLSSGNATNYTGDGTSGIYLWGAQLSDSASLDPYVYNPGASPTAAAYYGPRFDYDPVTLSARGLLIEEQRTNLVLQSQSFDDVSWAKAATSVTANVAVSPDGTQDAEKIVEDTSTGGHNIVQTLTIADNTVVTASAYIKADGRSWVAVAVADKAGGNNRVWFNVTTGVQGTTNGTVTAFAASATGNGWYRISVSASVSTGVGTPGIRISLGSADNTASYTGNGTSGVFIWGAQLEAGSFATSYIPTTTAAATRAADVATMTGANFNNWYRQDEGTLFFEGNQLQGGNGTGVAYAVSNNTFNTSMYGNYSGGNTFRGANFIVGGVGQAEAINTFTGITASNVLKDAFAYRQNDFAESLNGSTARVDFIGSVNGTSDRMYIGSNWSGGGNFLNGHIRRIAFYPRRLSNAELQGITQ